MRQKDTTILANWGRPGQPMSDEQRRAMFWRMSQGGGGARQPSSTPEPSLPQSQYGPGWTPPTDAPKPYDDSKPLWRQMLSAAWDGFREGAEGGATILADTMTHGVIDDLHKAANSYQGADYDFSRGAAWTASLATEIALTSGAMSGLSAAWNGTRIAGTTAGKVIAGLTPTATAIGGLSAKNALENYIYANPMMDPRKEKTLKIAADIAGYVGSMGLFSTAGQVTGGIAKRIPVSSKLTKGTLDKLQKVFTSYKDTNGEGALGTLTTKGKMSLAGAFKTAFAYADKGFIAAKGKIGGIANAISPKATALLKKAHKAYTGFSEFTGSTFKELKAGAFAPKNQAAVKKLAGRAAELETQAQYLEKSFHNKIWGKPSTYGISSQGGTVSQTGYIQKGAQQLTRSASEKIKALLKLKTPAGKKAALAIAKASNATTQAAKKALDPLQKGTLGSMSKAEKALAKEVQNLAKLVDSPYGATKQSKRFLRDAAQNLNEAATIQKTARDQIYKLNSEAAGLRETAKALASRTKEDLLKSAYVLGMHKINLHIEEKGSGKLGEAIGWGKGIDTYEKEARAAFEAGKGYELPNDTPRGVLGMIAALTIGVTGNPLEKMTRGGWAREQAEQGAYRAKYAMIDEALAAGKITERQAKFEHEKLIDDKPWKMQGRSAWNIASALSSFANWKIGEVQSKARRSTYETLKYVYDGDSVKTAESGMIRLSRANTPELKSVHGKPPEMYGKEAADLVKRALSPFATIDEKTGQPLQKPLYGQSAIERMGGTPKIRVVADSHWQARQPAGANYGDEDALRPVASYEYPESKFAEIMSRIPIIRTLVPMQDVGELVMEQGLAALRYKNLSGRTDKDKLYGQLQEKAMEEGKNIFSLRGLADPALSSWAGKERYLKEPPPQPWRDAGNFWGSGLMATGNTGVFSLLPVGGKITAQAWNAFLAGIGTAQYNEGARIAPPKVIYGVSSISTANKAEAKKDAQAGIASVFEANPLFSPR